MKTTSLIATLLVCWSLHVTAQGVRLSSGDSLTIGFNQLGCQFSEGTAFTSVGLMFGNDHLDSGEMLRVEMFENTLDDSAFASQLFAPGNSVSFVQTYGPRAWLDHQGLVRITYVKWFD